MTPEQLSTLRPRYGALELKQTYQRGLGLALFFAVLLHLAAIAFEQSAPPGRL